MIKKFPSFLAAFVLICFLNSCSNATNYDAMAKELCECMTPLLQIQEEVKALATQGKMDEISLLLPRIEELSTRGDECVAKLEEKYGMVRSENEEKANEAFKRACPKIAAML